VYFFSSTSTVTPDLEFHGEFVPIDGNFLNQSADGGFVVFRDGGGLFFA